MTVGEKVHSLRGAFHTVRQSENFVLMGFMPLDDVGISVSTLFQPYRLIGCQRHPIQHCELTNILEDHLPFFILPDQMSRTFLIPSGGVVVVGPLPPLRHHVLRKRAREMLFLRSAGLALQ